MGAVGMSMLHVVMMCRHMCTWVAMTSVQTWVGCVKQPLENLRQHTVLPCAEKQATLRSKRQVTAVLAPRRARRMHPNMNSSSCFAQKLTCVFWMRPSQQRKRCRGTIPLRRQPKVAPLHNASNPQSIPAAWREQQVLHPQKHPGNVQPTKQGPSVRA